MQALRLGAMAFFVALLFGWPGSGIAGSPLLSAQIRDLPDIVAPLLPAVVNISTLKRAGVDEASGKEKTGGASQALGSGFIIDPAGYIVTNRHVIVDAYSVTVVLSDGRSYPAQVLSTNERPDLALLKIDAGKGLPTVAFGDSDTLRVGETVVAIGNPLGLSSSVSVGVVSALNRDVNTTMIDDFIQTDAAINHGNSGGPLFNLQGKVVGVNWALLAPGAQSGSAGLGFAIPSNDVAWVVDQMRRYGRPQAGYVGVRLQQVTQEMQTLLKLPSRNGGIVTAVWADGPAGKAGIREGDVLLQFNGREPRDVRSLLRSFGASVPGKSVSVLVWRDGTTRTVELAVENWADSVFSPIGRPVTTSRVQRQVLPDLGLRLSRADDHQRQTLKLSVDQPAVAVVDVAANSQAADGGLAAGDVILRVQQDRVSSPEEVTAKLNAARAEGREAVLMLVQTLDRPHWVVVPIHQR